MKWEWLIIDRFWKDEKYNSSTYKCNNLLNIYYKYIIKCVQKGGLKSLSLSFWIWTWLKLISAYVYRSYIFLCILPVAFVQRHLWWLTASVSDPALIISLNHTVTWLRKEMRGMIKTSPLRAFLDCKPSKECVDFICYWYILLSRFLKLWIVLLNIRKNYPKFE